MKRVGLEKGGGDVETTWNAEEIQRKAGKYRKRKNHMDKERQTEGKSIWRQRAGRKERGEKKCFVQGAVKYVYNFMT